MAQQHRRTRTLALVAAGATTVALLSPTSADSADRVRGGGHRVSVTLDEGTNIGVAVSPDAERVIFDLQGDLYAMSMDGGRARRLNPAALAAARPDWSPDGDAVVFQAYAGSNFQVMTMRPDGTRRHRLTHGAYDSRDPVYSPNGSKVAYSSNRAGTFDIWVLDLESGTRTRWSKGEGSEIEPTWSPDGERVAYVAESTIESVDADGNIETVQEEPGARISTPAWSPDGETMVYTRRAGNASELYADGERISAPGEDVFPLQADWIAGDELVYAADGKIRHRTLGDASVSDIPFSVHIEFRRPSYTPKEHEFGTRRGSQPVTGIVSPVVSPDGEHVAFVALNDLWVMRIGRRPRRVTHDTYAELTPTWSPDGSRLAYSSDRSGYEAVYVRDVSTGEERRLNDFDSSEYGAQNQYGATWCPAGDKIAFQTGLGGFTSVATFVTDLSTGETTEAIGSLFQPGRPSWGPDCESLAIAAPHEDHNEILSVDLASGERRWIDPAPANNISTRASGNGPVWSPDGTRIAFVRDDVLWVMRMDESGDPKSAPKPITGEVADEISWTGDSRRLMYLSAGTLRTVGVGGGRSRTVRVPLRWRNRAPRGLTIIRAGRLWDGAGAKVRRDVFVLVRRERILAVLPSRGSAAHTSVPDVAGVPAVADVARLRSLPGVRFVDASKLTVMPGLIDSHVHSGWAPFLGSRQGRQMLSYGITGAISMGDPAYTSLEQKESVLAGRMVAPRLFAGAEAIDGSQPGWGFMRATDNRTSLRRQLGRIGDLDVDSVKTYMRLPNGYRGQAIRAAHEMGLPSFSHYFYPAMRFGQDGMSHLHPPTRRRISRVVSQTGRFYEDVEKLSVESQMAIHLTEFNNTLLAEHPETLTDPRIRTLYADWQQADLERAYEQVTSTDQTQTRELLTRWQSTLRRLHRRGTPVMVGTDMPLNQVAYGLHQVLRMMVRFGGFEPYEALRAATVGPAKQFGVADEIGRVRRGYVADLTFVRGNPLRDIEDADNVAMVMRGGRLFTMRELLAPFRD